MKKRISGLLALLLVLVITAQPAFAADEIKIIKVGATEAYNNGTSTVIYSFDKTPDVSVTTTDAVYRVSIGSHNVYSHTVSGATYTFTYSDYDFVTPGQRNFTVTAYAYDDTTSLDSTLVNAYYYEQDMFYRNENAFKSGNVTAFDSGIKIVLGKSNYFKDVSKLSTGDNVIKISLQDRTNSNFGSNDLSYYSCVSPVYRVEAGVTSSVYTSKPATITLGVDAGVPPSQYSKLSIVRSKVNDDFASGRVEFLGGVANASKKTIISDEIISLPGYDYAVVMYNNVINADWAEFSVTPLLAKGIIDKGKINNLTNNTSRGDFAKMIVKGMGIPLLPELPDTKLFSDIADSDRIYIETAAAYGIMRGVSSTNFNPNDPLTREQAAAVLANAAKLKLTDDQDKVSAGLAKLYADNATISSWAGPAVMAVTQAKLMKGSPVNADDPKQGYNFSPTTNLNYLESATMVYNLMKKNKRI